MSEALHTPGPWAVGPYFDNEGSPELIIEHQTPHGNMVVAVALPGLVGQHANGLVIAAAPDLLEALQQTLALAMVKFGNLDPDANKVFEQAQAAIARATGKGE